MLLRLAARALLLVVLSGSAFAGVRLTGKVSTENNAPLSGVKLVLRSADGLRQPIPFYTDPAGAFEIDLPAAGGYLIDVDRVGYFPLRGRELLLGDGENVAEFIMQPVREEFSSVDVSAAPPPIDMDTASPRETVAGVNILNTPHPTTNNLRNALRIVPGVVQDSRGGLHIDGGAENQALYTLDGFNITDPLTGRFGSRLSVEGVQTVELASGSVAAEYGKGSAGVMAIHTRTGDDRFRASATNFFPGIENRKGIVIGNWTPRINLSGPIMRGRAWFFNSLDTAFTNTVVEELPNGEDRTRSWNFSNHLNTQVNLTPGNILHAGFLVNLFFAPRSNLGVLDPYETTVDRRDRQWFFHVKDQIYLPNRALLEVGYAANRTFGREIPQGHEMYRFTPEGRAGNYFRDATRHSSRDQLLASAVLPAFSFRGEHRVKAGVDLNRLGYWQDMRRTGFVNLGRNDAPTRRTEFGGDGTARIQNYEASVFAQDSWRLRPSLLLELGLRGDWDQLLHYWNVSPRLGVAWQPPGLHNTKFTAGYGLIYDSTPLDFFLRPQDQYSITTYFDPEGQVNRGPALTIFTIPHPRLARPRYTNQTVGMEQQFPKSFHARLDYIRKRGRMGFAFQSTGGSESPSWITPQVQSPAVDAVYGLTNGRHDSYDAFRATLRHVMKRQYEWMVSYTRSSARSNSVVDTSVDNPVTTEDNDGRLPWDAPNRLLSWGFLPTPWKNWSTAYLVDWHTGFPFAVIDEYGQVVGSVDSRRFPSYFEVNLHLERRFEFRNWMWAFRMGCNNVTNHGNSTVVNNNVSSAHFLNFYGGRDRSFNFRIRWLGRSGS